MTAEDIILVQTTFLQLLPQARPVAASFYARLFELDPALRPLFKGNIEEQGDKLMHMLWLAVSGLNKLEQLTPAVRQLGRRHAGYGVSTKDYATVGAALLWMLEQRLGTSYTPAVSAAWLNVYTLLATVMQESALVQV